MLSADRLLVHRPSACAAAIKAFIVNRVGDLAFAVGIALIFFKFGSIEFPTIFGAIARMKAIRIQLLGRHLARL